MQMIANTGRVLTLSHYEEMSSPVFDLMIRREGVEMRPVIFLNPEIPEILRRILEQYDILAAEARMSARLSCLPGSHCPAPLVSWYECILGNVYSRESKDRRKRPDTSFALSCSLFTPEENSGYYYVSLELPPLWERPGSAPCSAAAKTPQLWERPESAPGSVAAKAPPYLTDSSGTGTLPASMKDRHAARARLNFRCDPSTGSWYAGVAGTAGMKNVFSRYFRTQKISRYHSHREIFETSVCQRRNLT